MSFIFYDVLFLVLFVIAASVFLNSRKKNLKKEGLLILYKASWGIKLINYVGKKSAKTFKVLSYISITIGYLLMAGIIYMIGKIVYIYGTMPAVVQAIKIPPIIPLVPYLPEIFKLGFLPPFYFTYWILIIAIIAITHEFAHGIFAAYNKIKIKSTGFGFFPFFLPIFLAAFVELDEKRMAKKSNFSQMAILSAGTFANVLTAILFFALIWVFFIFAFTPSGVIFDNYPYSVVELAGISMVNGVSLDGSTYERILELSNEEGFNKIKANNQSYMIMKSDLEKQENNDGNLILYYDAPAINSNLGSIILKINNVEMKNIETLQKELLKYSPGEKITINTIDKDGEDFDLDLVLGENPSNKNLPWLGVGFTAPQNSRTLGKVYSTLAFKDPHIYYESKLGDFGGFIYNLLWWVVLISLSVALINMLPVGIFDGGRFFYLTVLAITKNEKISKRLFSFSTYFILFLFLLLMVFWAKSLFF